MAVQRNASDPKQTKRAGEKATAEHARMLANLRAVMLTPEGRITMWAILGFQPPDQSVFDHSGSIMYFQEGKRNITLRLKATLIEADEDLYVLMEKEMRTYQRGEDRGNAGHLSSAETIEESHDA